MNEYQQSTVGECAGVLEALASRDRLGIEEQTHIACCQACQEIVAVKRAVEEHLEAVPSTLGQKPAWIHEAQERRLRRRRWWAYSTAGLVAAAAATLAVWSVPGPRVDATTAAVEPSNSGTEVGRAPAQSVPGGQESRPTWVRRLLEEVDKPHVDCSHCLNNEEGIECVAVSSYSDSLDDAKRQVGQESVYTLLRHLDKQINAESFRHGSRAVYQRELWSGLGGSLRAVIRPSRKVPRPEALARAEVALSTAIFSSQEVPHHDIDTSEGYWEEYARADGRSEFKAYARAAMEEVTRARLIQTYTLERAWGGTTVMNAFPLVAFSHADFDGGVVVTGEDTQRLPRLAVILEVNGKRIRTIDDLEDFSPRDTIVFATPIDTEE